MPQQDQLEGYAPNDTAGESVDPVVDINTALQELSQFLSGQGPETREEEAVTQEMKDEFPPPSAEEMPPTEETNAQARLRAARSALANNPFGARTT
tara:strand:+ start:44 stop:331 length:288 start_codon:yes stop_codon:yes gene_type:complete